MEYELLPSITAKLLKLEIRLLLGTQFASLEIADSAPFLRLVNT